MDFDKIMNWVTTELPDAVMAFIAKYGPNLVWAVVTFVVGRWVVRIVRRVVIRFLKKTKLDPTLIGFVSNMLYMLLMLFVVISALRTLGVHTTSFVALIGAAGLAIGFALQGSLANFAAGVMIIMFKPFKIGDYVEAGGTAGVIEEIQIFSTVLKTPDNKKVICPNGQTMGGTIVNYSANPTRRVDLIMGISYDDDLKKAKEILERIVRDHPLVLDDPKPVVVIRELADSSVNFNVRPWCKGSDYWTVYGDVTEAVKIEFDKADISIPYPQRDVHLHQVA